MLTRTHELKGAKKGTASRRVPTRASCSPRSTSTRSRCPAAATRSGGSPRCAGCAACTTAPRRRPARATIDGRERPGVQVETVAPRRRAARRRAACPPTGLPPQAFSSFNTATIVTVGARHPDRRAGRDHRHRARGGRGRPTATCRCASASSPRPSVVIDQRGSGTYADNVEIRRRRRGPAHGRLDRRLGRRRRARQRAPRPRWARTRCCATSRSRSAATWCG